jgi:DNA-binding CsgD family transcriptional regulator
MEMAHEVENGSEPLPSDREKEVLLLMSADFTTREIARKLSIKIKTVEFHRAWIKQKLRVKRLAGVVKYAIRAGLVQA